MELDTTESEKEWQFLGTVNEEVDNQCNIKLKIDTEADITDIPVDLYDQQKDGPLDDINTLPVEPD